MIIKSSKTEKKKNKNLDLPERDQKTLLNLSIQPKKPGGVSEITASCGEGIHVCLRNPRLEKQREEKKSLKL